MQAARPVWPLRTVSLAMLALLAACGEQQGGASGPIAPQPHEIRVHVDDAPAVIVRASDCVARTPLATFLPEALRDWSAWVAIEASGAGRTLHVDQPADKYPDHDVMLYLDEAGWPSLGLFRRERADWTPQVRAIALGAPSLHLNRPDTVTVRTRDVPRPQAPALLPALFVDGVQAAPLDAATLEGAPEAVVPGDASGGGGRRARKEQHQGWSLTSVLAGVRTDQPLLRVHLIGAAEAFIELTAEELAAPEAQRLLRRNRRGEWIYREGQRDGQGPARELRGVQRIELHTR